MAQLWGGRFTKETDKLVYDFNASITFDKKLFEQDIEGSIAHVVMLEKQGVLSLDEKDAIVKGLTQIRKDVEEGKLADLIMIDLKQPIMQPENHFVKNIVYSGSIDGTDRRSREEASYGKKQK